MFVQVYITLWSGDKQVTFRFQSNHNDMWKEIRSILKWNLYDYMEMSVEQIDKITDLFVRRNDLICIDHGRAESKKEC